MNRTTWGIVQSEFVLSGDPLYILFLLSILFTCFENLLLKKTSDISILLESSKIHFYWFPDDFKVDKILKIYLNGVHAFSNSIF